MVGDKILHIEAKQTPIKFSTFHLKFVKFLLADSRKIATPKYLLIKLCARVHIFIYVYLCTFVCMYIRVNKCGHFKII
jgi:hypothetical protein